MTFTIDPEALDEDVCFQPGWDEGPVGVTGTSFMCELGSMHDTEHLAHTAGGAVTWPVTWTVEDDGTPPDVTYSMLEDPRGN